MNEIGKMTIGDNVVQDYLQSNRIALFDCDFLKYIVTDRIWKTIQDEGEHPTLEKVLQEEIDRWFEKIKDPIIFCFSGKSNETFRNHVCFEKQYKVSRLNKNNSYRYYEGKVSDAYGVVGYIQKRYPTLFFKDLEADDIVSALQDKEHTYIISKDKDLKQVPGYHYDFGLNEIHEITDEMAHYNLCLQLLKGDSDDDIPGIKGVGEKAAVKILDGVEVKYRLRKILFTYQKRFGMFEGTDRFAETWMMVKTRMNRGEYFKEKYKSMFDLKQMIINEYIKKK